MDFKQSPNYWNNRKGYTPEAIVLHIMDGTFDGTVNWFSRKESQVSAHYLVGKDGRILQMVKDEHVAWHAGVVREPKWRRIKHNVNPNLYTIGIEIEGTAHSLVTLEQIIAVSHLLSALASRWGIPLTRDYVVGHNTIRADKLCPGKVLPIGYVVARAKILKH